MTREEYDSCRISQADPRVVAVCDKPHTQLQFTITFRYSTVQYNAVQFLFIIASIICDTRVRSVAAISRQTSCAPSDIMECESR